MNNLFLTPTFDPFDAHGNARDAFKDENDISKTQNHKNRDVFREEAFHLISYDPSFPSLDFTMVDEDSLEPTPIRPQSILCVNPQNTACVMTTTFHPKSSPLYTFTSYETITNIPASSRKGMISVSNEFVQSLERDSESGFIPSNIARMVSTSSFARSPLCDHSNVPNPQNYVPSSHQDCRNVSTTATCLDLDLHGTLACAINNTDNHPQISTTKNDNEEMRFRTYQSDQWMERYEELKDYKEEFGHCLVPHTYLHKGSPALVS
jgi:hypothetical protein